MSALFLRGVLRADSLRRAGSLVHRTHPTWDSGRETCRKEKNVGEEDFILLGRVVRGGWGKVRVVRDDEGSVGERGSEGVVFWYHVSEDVEAVVVVAVLAGDDVVVDEAEEGEFFEGAEAPTIFAVIGDSAASDRVEEERVAGWCYEEFLVPEGGYFSEIAVEEEAVIEFVV